jgi:uncharacterized protein (DUF1015 family)
MPDSSPSLLPFRGLRYRPDLPGNPADTIGPPFDLDSTTEAREFAAGRAHCAVHLEIEDDGDALSFGGARRLIDDWRSSGILRRDESPSYYVYEQRFSHEGDWLVRRGIFGLVPLDDPGVTVLPHEETWEENRLRRVQLLRGIETSPSSVYLIYEDSHHSIQPVLDEMTSREPDWCATDNWDNRHRLWAVSDTRPVERIRALMAGQQFVIADGHHRHAAARIYHDERGLPETSAVLACCVEAGDPGIVIRPIHRLIHSRDAIDIATATGTLAELFEIDTSPVGERTGRELRLTLSSDVLPEAGIITNDGLTFLRLRLRDWAVAEAQLPGEPHEPSRRLDVTVITELVLRRALDVEPTAQNVIDYYDDAEDVLALARAGKGVGLLMRPMRLRQVFDVARSRGTVPPKSTSFIPKIPVGLVMHEFLAPGREDGQR